MGTVRLQEREALGGARAYCGWRLGGACGLELHEHVGSQRIRSPEEETLNCAGWNLSRWCRALSTQGRGRRRRLSTSRSRACFSRKIPTLIEADARLTSCVFPAVCTHSAADVFLRWDIALARRTRSCEPRQHSRLEDAGDLARMQLMLIARRRARSGARACRPKRVRMLDKIAPSSEECCGGAKTSRASSGTPWSA